MFIHFDIETLINNCSDEDLLKMASAATEEFVRRMRKNSAPDAAEIELFTKGDRIKAIKLYRNRTGRALKDSVADFAAKGMHLGVQS